MLVCLFAWNVRYQWNKYLYCYIHLIEEMKDIVGSCLLSVNEKITPCLGLYFHVYPFGKDFSQVRSTTKVSQNISKRQFLTGNTHTKFDALSLTDLMVPWSY